MVLWSGQRVASPPQSDAWLTQRVQIRAYGRKPNVGGPIVPGLVEKLHLDRDTKAEQQHVLRSRRERVCGIQVLRVVPREGGRWREAPLLDELATVVRVDFDDPTVSRSVKHEDAIQHKSIAVEQHRDRERKVEPIGSGRLPEDRPVAEVLFSANSGLDTAGANGVWANGLSTADVTVHPKRMPRHRSSNQKAGAL
jgi:hypothetical protein